ncbi:excinuclease ABC subunit UvrC [uncultured Ezakiella sp.]|uniref:excinuclease ABC subunit UvrC n=1 Tax=uncultured Ezakiella sp. TaxID=1637529 RepID=UPI0025F8172E|nr:excinuclease ABC subunit UvrC [uncultured Ezakiella sp.]
MKFDIKEELKKLPAKPGVYIMKDKADNIIYVGKAKSLKNRVRSYFQSGNKAMKVEAMVKNIDHFEYIIVDSEVESLILESNLIKTHAPKYNILLRDDKSYPYIKITNEDYPRIIKTRELKNDGGRYYGPFPNAYAVNIAVEKWEDMYRLRRRNKNIDKISEPCLNYYIHKCDAPCARLISVEDYAKKLVEPIDFLEGRNKKVIERLEAQMLAYAKEMEYEKAAEIKYAIDQMGFLKEEQKITNPLGDSADYIAYAKSNDIFLVEVFFKRDGKMIGKDNFVLNNISENEHQMMEEFIKQYYVNIANPPSELLVEIEPDNIDLLEKALKGKGTLSTKISVPKRGVKRNTIMMVKKNAMEELAKHKSRLLQRTKTNERALLNLAEIIGTGEYPSIIESFDISHIQGTDAVGAMVVFIEGNPNRNGYRRFKIKNKNTGDDLASMREVLTRRYKRLVEGSRGFNEAPDLIMMDGGQTQINVCKEVLDSLGLDIPVMGMVKDDFHKSRAILYEGEEYELKNYRDLYTFVSTLQNEVHRFAISYHKSLRGKTMIKSRLDGIKGIGPKRKKVLMEKYGSIEKIKNADVEELSSLPGMNTNAALSVKEELAKYD